MAQIEVNVKRFVKYICCFYFGLPDPKASGLMVTEYAKKIQDSKLAQKLKTQSVADKTVA